MHASGWSVLRIEWLHVPWPAYRVLQHSGSVLGMLVVSAVYFRWRLRSQGKLIHWSREHRVLLLHFLCATALGLPGAWAFASHFEGSLMARVFVVSLDRGLARVFLVLYLARGVSLCVRAKVAAASSRR